MEKKYFALILLDLVNCLIFFFGFFCLKRKVLNSISVSLINSLINLEKRNAERVCTASDYALEVEKFSKYKVFFKERENFFELRKTTEEMLRKFFVKYGELNEISIARDYNGWLMMFKEEARLLEDLLAKRKKNQTLGKSTSFKEEEEKIIQIHYHNLLLWSERFGFERVILFELKGQNNFTEGTHTRKSVYFISIKKG